MPRGDRSRIFVGAAALVAPRAAASMALNTPLVMLCKQCRQPLTDSNQLVCAVAELDALVMDAVLGVRIDSALKPGDGADAGCTYCTLWCTGCESELGRQYTTTRPEMSQLVATTGARYVLHRSALQSYALGSTKIRHDEAMKIAPSEDASAENGVPAPIEPANGARDERPPETVAATGAGAEGRVDGESLSDVHRMLLYLDQRVQALEAAAGHGEDGANAAPLAASRSSRKRPR